MAENIYEVLEWLRKDPQLYLSNKTTDALRDFVNGFYLGLSLNRMQMSEETPPFRHFPDWLERRFKRASPDSKFERYTRAVRDSFLIVSEEYEYPEEAFHNYFSLLDEFRRRQSQIVGTAYGSKEGNSSAEQFQAIRYIPDEGLHFIRIRKSGPAIDFSYFETFNGLINYAEATYGIRRDSWKIEESTTANSQDRKR